MSNRCKKNNKSPKPVQHLDGVECAPKAIIHICMISDDNYVAPTCVAITSFIKSKKASTHYVIHIIASSLNKKSKNKFKNLETDKISIDIIEKDSHIFDGFHIFDPKAICAASQSALFKFLIPDILVDLDKVLYLDGDLISNIDLSEIFNIDISKYYAAVVPESGQIYYKHKFVLQVQKYFNSGVMLLNLAKMRQDEITPKLLQTKQASNDSNLMDQNVFNLIFDGNLLYLSIRYNFMPVSLYRAKDKWTIKQINELYGTQYVTVRDMYHDAAIIHYSSKDKPWKNPDGALSHLWRQYECPAKMELSRLALTVIMPTYNVEQYIREAIDSVLAQTFTNFELICLDDGSSDKTVSIIKEYQRNHSNIILVENTNHRQAYERNQGIELAKGEYIYYMDSDDIITPNCFATLVSRALTDKLDLILFEGKAFYENKTLAKELPKYTNMYNRKFVYPVIWNGKDLYCALRKGGDMIISPCLQLVRRALLIKENIRFPLLQCREDNLYSVIALLKSKRVACYTDVFYSRRVRQQSTMTGINYEENLKALSYLCPEFFKLSIEYKADEIVSQNLLIQSQRHLKRAFDIISSADDITAASLKELCIQTLGIENIISLLHDYIDYKNIPKYSSNNISNDLTSNVAQLRKTINHRENLLFEALWCIESDWASSGIKHGYLQNSMKKHNWNELIARLSRLRSTRRNINSAYKFIQFIVVKIRKLFKLFKFMGRK